MKLFYLLKSAPCIMHNVLLKSFCINKLKQNLVSSKPFFLIASLMSRETRAFLAYELIFVSSAALVFAQSLQPSPTL